MTLDLSWKKTLHLLLLLLLVGTLLRFYHLGENSLVADEFLDMNSSYGYFKTGQWKAWDFNFGKPAEMNQNDARDERAFVYKAQVAKLFTFLSPTETTARTISVLWGIFDIFLIFWVAYRLTGRKEIGLLAAFLLTVSISALIFDRRLRMYAMFTPIYLAFSWTLYAWLEGKATRFDKGVLKKLNEMTSMQWLWVIPAGLLGLFTIETHLLTVNIIPVMGLYLLVGAVLAWKRGEGWKNKYTGLMALGLLGFLAVFFERPKLIGTIFNEFTFFNGHYSYFQFIGQNYWHPLIGFFLILLGSASLWKMGKTKETLWLTLSFWLPLLMAVAFWKQSVGAQYIFFLQSFGMILAATGLFALYMWLLKTGAAGGTKKYMLGTFGLLLLLTPNWAYFFQENNTYHETSSGDNPNYRKVFTYFKKYQAPEDVLITRNFRNYYWSGAHVPVFDFGGEVSHDKLTLTDVQGIMATHPHGWLILSTNDYDYISNEAEQFFKKNMELVSNAQVRGPIEVYRWGNIAGQ